MPKENRGATIASWVPWQIWVSCCPIKRWATFSVGMDAVLLLRENRPSPGKTLSVHTWKFWWGRIFSLWKFLTVKGLVTYYVLFFIPLESRRVSLAGMTLYPGH